MQISIWNQRDLSNSKTSLFGIDWSHKILIQESGFQRHGEEDLNGWTNAAVKKTFGGFTQHPLATVTFGAYQQVYFSFH